MSKNPKNEMKIVNLQEGNLHMWLMIMLKVTKNWGFTLFLENAFLQKMSFRVNIAGTMCAKCFWV